MKPSESDAQRPKSAAHLRHLKAAIALAVLIRLAAIPFAAHPYDMAVWIAIWERFWSLGINPFFRSIFGLFPTGLIAAAAIPTWIIGAAVGTSNVLVLQAGFKVMLIPFDLLAAVGLRRMAKWFGVGGREADVLLLLWLFNPLVVYVTYIHGQTVIVPVSLSLLGLTYLTEHKFARSMAALTIAASFQFALALLAAPALLVMLQLTPSWKGRSRILGTGAGLTISNFAPILASPGGTISLFTNLSSRSETVARGLPNWSIWTVAIYEGAGMLANVWPLVAGVSVLLIMAHSVRRGLFRARLGPANRFRLLVLFSIASLLTFMAVWVGNEPQSLLIALPLVFLLAVIHQQRNWLLFAFLAASTSIAIEFAFTAPRVFYLDSISRGSLWLTWAGGSAFVLAALGAAYGLLLLGGVAIALARQRATDRRTPDRVFALRREVGLTLTASIVIASLMVLPLASALVVDHGPPNAQPVDLRSLNTVAYPTERVPSPSGADFTGAVDLVANTPAAAHAWEEVNLTVSSPVFGTRTAISLTGSGQPAVASDTRSVSQSFTLNFSSAVLVLETLVAVSGPQSDVQFRLLEGGTPVNSTPVEESNGSSLAWTLLTSGWYEVRQPVDRYLAEGTYLYQIGVRSGSATTVRWQGNNTSSSNGLIRYLGDAQINGSAWLQAIQTPGGQATIAGGCTTLVTYSVQTVSVPFAASCLGTSTQIRFLATPAPNAVVIVVYLDTSPTRVCCGSADALVPVVLAWIAALVLLMFVVRHQLYSEPLSDRRRVRVAIVSKGPLGSGGLEEVCRILAEELSGDTRFEVTVFGWRTGSGSPDPRARHRVVQIPTIDLHGAREVVYGVLVACKIFAGSYDVVHVHGEVGAFCALVRILRPETRLLVTFHGTYWGLLDAVREQRIPVKGREGVAYRALCVALGAMEMVSGWGSDRVVAVSPRVREEALRFGFGSPEKLDVVGNTLATPTPSRMGRSEARRKLGWPQDAPIILYVGRDWRRKGLKRALELVEEIQSKDLPAQLYVVGFDSLPAPLAHLSRVARPLGNVPSETLREMYEAANFLLLPTGYEGDAMTIREALAHGLPVITTPQSGLAPGAYDLVHMLQDLGTDGFRELVRGVAQGSLRTAASPSESPKPSAAALYETMYLHLAASATSEQIGDADGELPG